MPSFPPSLFPLYQPLERDLILSKGDFLKIAIYGDEETEQDQVLIAPDGKLYYSFVDAIPAAGRTIAHVATELEKALQDYQKISLPWEAAFIASKAYAAYRRNGGQRHTLMPDFYIGAHALFEKHILVTRDKGYVKYFPSLQCISP